MITAHALYEVTYCTVRRVADEISISARTPLLSTSPSSRWRHQTSKVSQTGLSKIIHRSRWPPVVWHLGISVFPAFVTLRGEIKKRQRRTATGWLFRHLNKHLSQRIRASSSDIVQYNYMHNVFIQSHIQGHRYRCRSKQQPTSLKLLPFWSRDIIGHVTIGVAVVSYIRGLVKPSVYLARLIRHYASLHQTFSQTYSYSKLKMHWSPFLPARRYASAIFATATSLSVRLSVRLDVCHSRYCAKTVHFRRKVTIGR